MILGMGVGQGMDWIGLGWRDCTYCIVENFRSQGFNFHRCVSDLYHFFVGIIFADVHIHAYYALYT